MRSFPLLVLIALSTLAPAARAESNRFNLHLTPGLQAGSLGIGGDFGVGADFQLTEGFGIDLRFGVQLLAAGRLGPEIGLNPMAGVRFRLLDDHQGYLNQPRGNALGHLAIAPHIGGLLGSWGAGFAIDTEVSYVFSVSKPLSVGPFLRPFIAFGSFGLGSASVAGGAVLGVELHFGFGAEMGRDGDGDGVPDSRDRCPSTPPNTEVDARGCTFIPKKLVLEGITFRLNSAEIEPASEKTMQRALLSLQDNPEVDVEISGHTDDQGRPEVNEPLSLSRAESVKRWLVSHGISPRRLTTRGYGATRPVVKGTDEAARAKNRRIEFNRLDQ